MPYKDKEKKRIYLIEWRKKHPGYAKKYTETEHWKEWHRKYVAGEVATEYRRKYNSLRSDKWKDERIARRNETLDKMGGKCTKCDVNDYRVLQIDHINGDGKRERNLMNRREYYANVLKSFLAGEGRYQLLCCNCNWIKRVEMKEYRKRSEEQTGYEKINH